MNNSTSSASQIMHNENACISAKKIGLHLSSINAESSEHTNKILKGVLVRLKRFTRRAKYCTDEVESKTALNHLGSVMFEHIIIFGGVKQGYV